MTDAVRDLLTLRLVPGIGSRLTAALLERFGSATAVLQAPIDQLAAVPHLNQQVAERIRRAMDRADLDAEVARMQEKRVTLLHKGESPYPTPLANIPDPPWLLYMRGALQERDHQAVALVGSRNCTSYGMKMADRLAAGLARAGFTVISGLARGIDGAAHRAALAAGGRTLAVLAGGLSKIYPPEHLELAEEITTSGALLTESAMLMEPMAGMFPARNRIISGLSRAVVIVEAAEKSGALITASHAADQGREVFAVPGAADSLSSAGALTLLRKGAKLARHADDILEDLLGIAPLVAGPATSAAASPAPRIASPPRPEPVGLDETQHRLWESLAGGAQHVDELTRSLALPVAELSRSLMHLEMKRVVRRLPGNRFERA
jgi:DNA processing protein